MSSDSSSPASWRDGLLAGSTIGLVVAVGFWLYTLSYNHLSPTVGDAFVVLIAYTCVFVITSTVAGLAISLAGRLLRLRATTVTALIAGGWTGFFLIIHTLVKGVYYSDWGIDSKWAALAIRIGQVLFAVLVALLVVAVVRWLLQRRYGRVMLIVVLVSLLGGVLIVSLGARQTPPAVDVPQVAQLPDTPPIAIIGLDGLTWNVIDPMVEEGKLPTFARLRANGAWAHLETHPLGSSPLIWNAISTGRPPTEHGVLGHVWFQFPGMERRLFFPHRSGFNHVFAPPLRDLGLLAQAPVSSADRLLPSFWNLACDQGRDVILLNWYGTWPAEEPCGLVLAHRLFQRYKPNRRAFGERNFSPAYMRSVGDDGELFARVIETQRANDERIAFWAQTAALVLDDYPMPDLFGIYLERPDPAQHRVWHLHEPEKYFFVDPEQLARRGDPIAELYGWLDTFVADIIALLPQDTIVILLSDHGAEAVFWEWGTRGGHNNGTPGVLMIHGPGVQPGQIDATIYDILPTLFTLKGLPLADDWTGRPLTEAFTRDLPQIATLPSYGGKRIDASAQAEEGDQKDTMEELKALGYIN
ncbi:MAG: alkaline phosphatase family protein [Acidobacteriota bacterium]